MGKIKELWGKQLEAIEQRMNAITAEYGHVLSFGDYLDHLLDYWTKDGLEDFTMGIIDHYEYLLELEENGKRP